MLWIVYGFRIVQLTDRQTNGRAAGTQPNSGLCRPEQEQRVIELLTPLGAEGVLGGRCGFQWEYREPPAAERPPGGWWPWPVWRWMDAGAISASG
jgi:hypothetical protein